MMPGQARLPGLAQPRQVIAVETTPPPALDTFGMGSSQDLLRICRTVLEGSRELISYVDQNRTAARNAGVETIAIELSGMVEGGSLGQIRDSLEESLVKNRPAEISVDGMAKLRRAEALLNDAGREMDKELGVARLGEAGPPGMWWVPVLALGAVVIAGIYLLKDRKPPPPVEIPELKTAGQRNKPVSGSASKSKK